MNHDDLFQSAQRLAEIALDDLTWKRYDMAALHAGVMVEHLTKAYLARLHPSLIVEAKSFDSLLFVIGRPELMKSGALRTIGLEEACKRVAQVLPTFPFQNPVNELRRLFEARNGVAHAAHVKQEDVSDVIIMAVQVVEAILADLQPSPLAIFWGRYDAQVRAMLMDRAAEVDDIVKIRIGNAKATFESRWGHLEGEQLDGRLAGIEVVPPGFDAETAILGRCPACGRMGYFVGEKDIRSLADWEGLGYALEVIPNVFACQVCGLFLPSAEFVRAAGLPHSVHVRDATQDEYLTWDESEPEC